MGSDRPGWPESHRIKLAEIVAIHTEETHPKRTPGRRTDARDAGVGGETSDALAGVVSARRSSPGEARSDRDLAGEESVPLEAALNIISPGGGQKREDLLRVAHSRIAPFTILLANTGK